MVGYALVKKEAMFPKNWGEQAVRFITTGGSLLLTLFSFGFLSAGTVSLLTRLDIPILIFFSAIARNNRNWVQIILSVLTVSIVLFLTIEPNVIDEQRSGFLLVFGGLILIVIGYLTVHKGSNTESIPALINIASISSILFGFALIVINKHSWLIPTKDIMIILVSSFVNIFLFYLTIERYKKYSPEKALFPFVLAILSTSILEMIIEHKIYAVNEMLVTIGLTILISAICLTGKSKLVLRGN